MTSEEAREWLRSIKDNYIYGGDEAFDNARREALSMADEALRCKPCEDAVSRDLMTNTLGATCIAKRDEKGDLIALCSIDHLPSVTMPCQREKDQNPEEFRKFAEWVARELFDDDWPHNMDAFVEVACRKLSKLGLVKDLGEIWGLADCFYTQKSEEETE